jgi:hypothetical protein
LYTDAAMKATSRAYRMRLKGDQALNEKRRQFAASRVTVRKAGTLVRVFSSQASDLAAAAAFALRVDARYRGHFRRAVGVGRGIHPPWPNPVGGFRLRQYDLGKIPSPDPSPLKMRVFRSTWLIDIFGPPRMDFSSRPGFVLNAAEYPAPKGAVARSIARRRRDARSLGPGLPDVGRLVELIHSSPTPSRQLQTPPSL